MNAKESEALTGHVGKRLSPWRSSLYEEPLWVSVAWVLGPVVLAALGIYFAVR
jgi:hypothetical protein